LKEEALDCTLWRTRFGRGYGPVVRQTTEWLTDWMNVLFGCNGAYPTSYSMGTGNSFTWG
jgi:hypothetical protein